MRRVSAMFACGLCCLLSVPLTVRAWDDSGVQDDTREAVKIIETARLERIKDALKVIKGPAPATGSWDLAIDFEQAIDRLGELRAGEAVPALITHFTYQRNFRLGGTDRSLLTSFPAAGAVAEIGAPAIPALVELAKGFAFDPGGRVPADGDVAIETRTLLVHVLYAAAGCERVVDDELRGELARLESVRPTADIQRQIRNLLGVLEETKRIHRQTDARRRLIDEYRKGREK